MKLSWSPSMSAYNEWICVDTDTGRIVGEVKESSIAQEFSASCRLKTEGGYRVGEYISLKDAQQAVDRAVEAALAKLAKLEEKK